MARKSKKTPSTDLEGQADPASPLDWEAFLGAAAPVLAQLKVDLGARARGSPAVAAALAARHAAELADKRTADSFIEWQDHLVEQVAAAWLLSCVFVRTLEDRGLLEKARLAGPGAADSLRMFLALAPSLNERDYLLTVFRELTRRAATRELFDERHNPVWLLAPSAEGAKALVGLFQQPRAELPAFRFGQADTSFLGWIYQDLDAGVRARFALLQTPRFVESFILDRTLEPAIEKFGLDDTTIIDPTCGSGHFLLGAFERLVEHRLRKEPGLSAREAARRALDAVYGADINPYAVAIARFRLTLAFFDKAGFRRLEDAPAPALHVVVADSLLHNPHLKQGELGDVAASGVLWRGEEFALEDEGAARAVLHRQFAAVVGNPPYITVKDAALREKYRGMYPRSAAGKYSVAAPFMERFFQLARDGGRVGMITANSFMKREFGKKLIEEYLPTVNLDGVINTSGAYIPGHGTPTVLLFGSAEPARGDDVLTVLASRGEPSTPEDAEQGLVWRSIADRWREVGFENEYVSVVRTRREVLTKHPWSLGGGGAAELKELLEERAERRLGEVVEDIGFASFTGLDEAFILPEAAARTAGIEPEVLRPMVTGEDVRDWAVASPWVAISPYAPGTHEPIALDPSARWARFLWRLRSNAKGVLSFGGKTRAESGENWWEWYRWQRDRYRAGFRIAFAEVATHNHFVLDRGGKVFKQTAPIIKLPATATEDDHLALLAYLNSSTACFWMKQVCFPKANHTDDRPERGEPEMGRYAFSASALKQLPIPPLGWARVPLLALAKEAEGVVAEAQRNSARNTAEAALAANDAASLIDRADELDASLEARLVRIQEDIDWVVYRAFGLLMMPEAHLLPPTVRVAVHERAFVRSDLPADFADAPSLAGQRIWLSRVEEIRTNTTLQLLENHLCKRRWVGVGRGSFGHGAMTYRERVAEASTTVRLEALERSLAVLKSPHTLRGIRGATVGEESLDTLSSTESASVPYSSAALFTDSGLAKHAAWQHTWHLQRREDAGETIPTIPVPPKYAQGDYRAATYWQLRGPLDVPKERFISYPGCESDHDGEPVYGWAGWDHEQRAKALATLYWNRKTEESWPADRITPMLAGLLELLPWLKQWHHEPSDEYGGDSPANYYAGFLDAECSAHGLTHDDLRAWRPAEKTRGKRKTQPAPAAEAAAEPEPKPKKTRAKKPKAAEESPS